MTLQEFNKRMYDLLWVEHIPGSVDKDGLHNGVQAWGRDNVQRVGFAVSASLEVFRMAAEAGCDVIVVHHGMLVSQRSVDRFTWERLAFLARNEMTLWSCHYVLDAHPTLGNNAQLLDAIGAHTREPFVDFSGSAWGYIADLETPMTAEEIRAALEPRLSPRTYLYDFGPEQVKRIVAVSGSGAPRSGQDMEELVQQGVDLYLTGDPRESTRETFREAGIHMLAGGHYHTETFGVQALQKHVEDEWGLDTVWLDLPNEI